MTDAVFIRIAPFINEKLFHPRHGIFPFNLGFAISLLEKKGFSCALLDTWINNLDEAGIQRFISEHHPRFLVIESTTKTIEVVQSLFRYSKGRFKCFNIAVGQLPSTMPGTLLGENRAADVCVRGESELAVEQLVSGAEMSTVPGIYFWEGKLISTEGEGIVDELKCLPGLNYAHFFKGKSRYRLLSTHIPIFRKKRWGFVLSSRGCPYNCIYCSPTLRQSYGSQYRFHPNEWVLGEIKAMAKGYGVNSIFFADDLFTLNRKRVIELCKLMIKQQLKVKWAVQTRADHLDKEMLNWMKRAGCTTLCLGIESGSNRILKILNKSVTREVIEEKLRLVKGMGFVLDLYFMIGNPEETEKEANETFKLARRYSPEMLRFAFFTPYPGSPFYGKAASKLGIDLKAHHYDNLAHNFSKIPSRRLKTLQKGFYRRYYLSLPYLIKYATSRLPYELSDFAMEADLIRKALRFLLRD